MKDTKDTQKFHEVSHKFQNTSRQERAGKRLDVTGITDLGSEIFVVKFHSGVNVYRFEDFKLTRVLRIDENCELRYTVSYAHYYCLYMNNTCWESTVYRYDLSTNLTTTWSVSGTDWGGADRKSVV